LRLFFALWPNAATRAALEKWALAMHAACGGRRTRTENLHQTLAFLGNIDDADVGSVEAAVDPVPPPSFTLRLDLPGYWKKNRIAWAGCSAVPRELSDLSASLRAALHDARIAFDTKPFAVHITLAREARAPAPAAMPVVEAIDWPVNGFALIASANGRYEIRREWRFGAA
jgi:2'-5' RNA ligase